MELKKRRRNIMFIRLPSSSSLFIIMTYVRRRNTRHTIEDIYIQIPDTNKSPCHCGKCHGMTFEEH